MSAVRASSHPDDGPSCTRVKAVPGLRTQTAVTNFRLPVGITPH